MKIRTLSLGSVAVIGLLLAGFPALAQGSYPHDSTPAERVQTNDLNTDAANRAHGNAAANAAAQSDYDAARAAYELSLNNYDARKATYDNDRARYEALRHDYDTNRAQRWNNFRYHDRYNDIASFHSTDLIGKMVSTRSGERIGRIRDVNYTADGRVNRIAIAVSYNRVAWLYADDVRYDPRSRVILIDLSRDQVDRLSRMRQPGT
jgi:sporulation protein YlmC with PRC-barrel domain